MIPYSFIVTSHFLITLGLSFPIFISITIVGFQRYGLHFLSFSLPAEVPLPFTPFSVLLELIPHCFHALSSGIRLFSNMMAGHSSVNILSGSAWTMLCMNDFFHRRSWSFIYSCCINKLGIRCSYITISCLCHLNLYLLELCYKSPSKWLFIYN